jgi:hypothetical protein
MKKKKTRRGGRANTRHPKLDQDAKIVSMNQDEKKVTHIKCHNCDELGHLASSCPNKLKKKAQANKKKQDNEKHHMSKKKRLNPRESATHVGKGDTWLIHVP